MQFSTWTFATHFLCQYSCMCPVVFGTNDDAFQLNPCDTVSQSVPLDVSIFFFFFFFFFFVFGTNDAVF